MNHSQGMFLRWREVTNVTEIENEAWHSVVVLATAQTTNLLLALAVLAHPALCWISGPTMIEFIKNGPFVKIKTPSELAFLYIVLLT